MDVAKLRSKLVSARGAHEQRRAQGRRRRGLAEDSRYAGAAGLVANPFRRGGREGHNSADTNIANVDEICEGKWLKVTVLKDGSFTVYNSRNRFEKKYPPR